MNYPVLSSDLIVSHSPNSADLAAAMVRSLSCGMRFGEKRMSVFVAYSDEAGVGDAHGEFLVSGYVAEESEWQYVAKAWQERVLDGPPKLPQLHMTEIRSRAWREKYGLTEYSSERRVDEAVNTIHSSGSLLAICSVVKQIDLRQIIQSRFGKKVFGFDEPDYLCHLAFFAVTLYEVHRRYPNAEKVNFFFSRKNTTITNNLLKIREQAVSVIDQYTPELASLMGDVIPASPDLILPLQAADIISWHLQRHYGNILGGKRPDRIEERRRWRLLKERDGHHVHIWKQEDLESFSRDVRGDLRAD